MPLTPLFKIGLDARAAELKEKLLKGRSQGQNRASPAQSPAPTTPQPPADASNPQTASTPARPLSERVKPPAVTLLATPGSGPRPTASLPADADDIAALISSISGSSIPGEIADPDKQKPQSAVESPEEAPKATEKKAPVVTTASSANVPNATASDPNRELPREKTGPAPPTQAPPRKQSRSSGNSSEVAQAVAFKKEPALSEPVPPEDALNRLLSQVPDLKDFLEMTDYYNVEMRTKKLDRFRRVKALAAEKLRIEEEERKLMEEEELEMELHRSTVTRFTGALSSAAAGSETHSVLTTPATPTPATPTPATLPPTPTPAAIPAEPPKAPPANPAKRAHGEEVPEPRPKMPRLDASPPPRSAGADSRPKPDGSKDRDMRDNHAARGARGARDLSSDRRPYPPSSPRYDDRYRRSPPPRPRGRSDYDGYDHRPKYDSYRHSSPERHRDSGSGYSVSDPVHVDLGRKGDSRFFILKSFNEENVRRCMEDGIWTTQVQNGKILSDAYATCRNVILFFSINKSRAFQGYARMSSPPSPTIPRPSFVKGIHWDTSDPFRVQWLSKTSVDFFRIGHLKNPLNEGAPVLVGKDGQEIEAECGAELLREMERFAVAVAAGEKGGKGGWEKRESAGGGGYAGRGGYRGGRYIKSEDTR
ncbi:YT521-B-like domain-containing protein [Staphylotrichum tortipilum]|uniref:YT521-B-like domain-containing protein n=1 Tax=Staphylotrichum tortipilum TaxID=2831512 RepID=A0AAN6MJV2_9PEZI|nr:YT521-B-like domain-containing protein [Staphylotrichum longicolle]